MSTATQVRGVDFSAFSGAWLMEESRVRTMLVRLGDAVRNRWSKSDKPRKSGDDDKAETAGDGDFDQDDYGTQSDVDYTVVDSVAVIRISGVLTKYPTDWDQYMGWCPVEPIKTQILKLADDYAIRGFCFVIDSPGGMVAGTSELAEVIARINKTKPCVAVVSDMAASGGYYLASQCRTITCNAMGEVGCIGVFCVLWDVTKALEEWGVSLTVVSSGGVKGLGADGKVSAELVADVQRGVNAMYDKFVADVATGRGLSLDVAKKLGDGRCWIAPQAMQMRLIDKVCSVEDGIAVAKAAATGLDGLGGASGASGTQGEGAQKNPGQKSGTGKAGPTSGHKGPQAQKGSPMDPEKKKYLVSIGLRSDATDEQAQTFYDLLNDDLRAKADAAEAGEDDGNKDGEGDGAGDTSTATGSTVKPAAAVTPAAPAVSANPVPANAAGATLPDLITACEGDKAVAADYFVAGLTVAQAKAAYGAVKEAKAEAAAAKQEAARAEFENGGGVGGGDSGGAAAGGRAVGVGHAAKERVDAVKAATQAANNGPVTKEQAKVIADKEWAKMSTDERSTFIDQATYVAARTVELCS